jgi:murein L,D-transpeptidase YcbB/YkuD
MRAIAWLALLWALGGAPPATATEVMGPVPAEVQDLLQRGDTLRVDGREITVAPLARFYRAREFAPAWGPDGDGLRRAELTLETLGRADDHGLAASDYVSIALRRRAQPATGVEAAERELLLTDALLRYAADVRGGRIRPAAAQPDWGIPERPPPDLAAGLAAAIEGDSLQAWLAALPPPHAGYARLVEALRRYRVVADRGGWPVIPPGPPRAAGSTDDRLARLRERLRLEGDLEAGADDAEALAQAIRRFQRRHGLPADGVAGAETVRALNVPLARRTRQVAANLERWRWLPRELERRHVAVNAADATLAVIDAGRPVLASRVVVGDREHPTPVVETRIMRVVFNPPWTVPLSIAVEEFLPRLRDNPRFLADLDVVILERLQDGSGDPHGLAVDWSLVSPVRFPFRLQQRPGGGNPLGRIKLDSPNRFDVFLHDTPIPELFERADRALSHGCVRVERAREITAFVLAGQAAGRPAAMERAMETRITTTVAVARPLPVYLLYWTAFVDGEGRLQLRDDVYGRDARLAAALARRAGLVAARATGGPGARSGEP